MEKVARLLFHLNIFLATPCGNKIPLPDPIQMVKGEQIFEVMDIGSTAEGLVASYLHLLKHRQPREIWALHELYGRSLYP